MDFEKNSSLHSRLLKSRRLHTRIRVTGAATPANKVHRPEFPELVKLKTEGKNDISAADSAASSDAGSSQDDSNGTFNVLLDAAELGAVEHVVGVDVQPIDGGTCTAALVNNGGTEYGLTAAGNILISVDSSIDLSAADLDIYLTVDYIRQF